jgi:hypothetical protein
MPNLQAQLRALAEAFADGVLAAIRSASLEDLTGDAHATRGPSPRARASSRPKRPGGRLARRSEADVEKVLASVVVLVKNSKGGLRSEQIRDALRLDRRELPRVLKAGLGSKKLRASGQKRATVYRAS